MRIGVLTGGGDCPGLNAAIRAIVRRALTDSVEVVGFKNGWLGLVENDFIELNRASINGILPRGGTILGTSRFNPLKDESSIERLKENWRTQASPTERRKAQIVLALSRCNYRRNSRKSFIFLIL
jgi:6-phosphofructokinase